MLPAFQVLYHYIWISTLQGPYYSYLQGWNGWSNSSLQITAAAATKSFQSCPTLCDPIDGSPPGSPVPGILQARTLEWVAVSFSNAGKWKVKVKFLSRVRLLAIPWTAAHQAPPSMGFSRQGYSSRLPFPSPPNNSNYKVKHLSLSHFMRSRSWWQLCAQLFILSGTLAEEQSLFWMCSHGGTMQEKCKSGLNFVITF